jgi:NAD(P)-dependent dehydrogenase (short-subunit alcohol dehydrogenase family)
MDYKTALVTGANRGIGFELCRQLAQRGFRVVGTARTQASADSAREALNLSGCEVLFVVLDTSDASSIKKAFLELDKAGISVDILINNAGVFLDNGKTVVDTDVSVFEETLQVNTLGPLMMARAVLPGMMRRRWGRIVNVSSGMGQFESLDGWAAAYRLSKTALNALTIMLADAGSAYGIQVNAVCPGWVQTAMGGASAPRTVEKGAETILWLALQGDDGPNGKMFRDMTEIPF